MGEYEPKDSRNVTGTASTPDGRWTGQAANDPTMTDRQRQMQQDGQSVGQQNDGVSGAGNQGNDHTSAIGSGQSAGAAGSGQAGYGNAGQGMSQPQQFHDTAGQQGGGMGGGMGSSMGRFADQIAKHQEVVDADGRHLGTVDHVDGDRIKLTRQDSPDGEHHYVSLRDVQGIEGGRVRLSAAAGQQGAGSGSGTQA